MRLTVGGLGAALALASQAACQVDKTNNLDINVPGNFSANTQTTIKLTTDADPAKLNYTAGVYLYDTVSNWYVCTLTNFTLSDLSVSITLPDSVGPSGYYYALAVYPAEGNLAPSWPFELPVVSDFFFLDGGTSAWSSAEAPGPAGNGLGSFFSDWSFSAGATIPCESYDCARKCAYKQLPYQAAWTDASSTWLTCLEACKGVKVMPSLTSSIAKATDWGGVPTPSTASVLALPTGSCDPADFFTPCGTKCCGPSQYCELWKSCISGYLGSGQNSSSTRKSATSTTTATSASGTAGSIATTTSATTSSTVSPTKASAAGSVEVGSTMLSIFSVLVALYFIVI